MSGTEATSGGNAAGPPPGEAARRGKRLVKQLILIFLFVLSAGGGSLVGLLLAYRSDLPQVESLQDYKPSIITQLFSDEGRVIAEFAVEKRVVIPYEQIPDHLKKALVAVEDQHFFRHPGIDPRGIARALYQNLLSDRLQGGSTITQQLSRLLFLTPERTYERKIKEALLAFQIEKNYTKEEILTLYCNQVLLGHGVYGVEAASEFYFGKRARDLGLVEAALIAGLPGAPGKFSPLINPKRALQRRNHVLDRMVAEGQLGKKEAEEAKKRPIRLHREARNLSIAPYFAEEVRKHLEERYGSQRIYRGGLQVHTTLNEAVQKAAARALDQQLRVLDKRQGFRPVAFNILRDGKGSIDDYQAEDWIEPFQKGQVVSGVVTRVGRSEALVRIGGYHAVLGPREIEWTGRASPAAILKPGDVTPFKIEAIYPERFALRVTLDQEPQVEGAFLALDVKSGQVKAMVGGFDFNRSKFNRATQAYRQTGSAFKPFVYAAAIDSGFTPTSLILDAPVSYKDPTTGEVYAPSNYEGTFEGWVTLRHALEKSRNVPAVRVANQIGPARVADMARRLGFSGPLPPYLSLALGSSEASLLEMVSAYSAFANQGIRMKPYFIRKVTDRDGNLLEETNPRAESAIRADTAYIMTSLLRGVIQRGTAARAASLGRPLGGKTGTTNDFTDAWFIGYDPGLAAGVWVGFDQKRPLGSREDGARAALPAWMSFMEEVLKDRPAQDFPIPSNIVFVPVDKHTGYPSPGSSGDVILEAFISGTEPVGYP